MWPVVTTWANVLVQAPELANAGSLQTTNAQNLFLQDAANWLTPQVWGGKLELGQRLLAAHLATLSLRRGAGGQVTEVGAVPARIAYADSKGKFPDSLDSTSYGLEYKRVRNTLPAARFAVGCGIGYIPFG